MAVMTPSRNFEGGDMGDNQSFTILRPEVKSLDIRKYKEGVRIFVLPPYKQDANGNGVWYRVISVRDNFGISEIKQRFVEPDNSPIQYFAAQAKQRFPHITQVQKVQKEGREFKVFPMYGRVAKRVLFNVALTDNVNQVLVFDAPTYGVGDVIAKYHNTSLADGTFPPLICDPSRACPIVIKMDRDQKGQPWSVNINPLQLFTLPPSASDSVNLYNLDLVCVVPSNEELVDKLKAIIPAEILNPCLQGYPGFTPVGGAVAVGGLPAPAAQPAANPVAQPVAAAPAPAPAAVAPAMANLAAAQPAPAAPAPAPVAAAPAPVGLQAQATASSVPAGLQATPANVAAAPANPAAGIPVANGALPTQPQSAEDLKKWLSKP